MKLLRFCFKMFNMSTICMNKYIYAVVATGLLPCQWCSDQSSAPLVNQTFQVVHVRNLTRSSKSHSPLNWDLNCLVDTAIVWWSSLLESEEVAGQRQSFILSDTFQQNVASAHHACMQHSTTLVTVLFRECYLSFHISLTVQYISARHHANVSNRC